MLRVNNCCLALQLSTLQLNANLVESRSSVCVFKQSNESDQIVKAFDLLRRGENRTRIIDFSLGNYTNYD